MKYLQPGGVGGSPELGVLFRSHPLSHLWYRAKVRFSPGFTTTGTLTNSANAYKLLSWGWQGCGSGRVEITNTDQYDVYENVQNCTTGALTGAGGHASGGRISGEWTTGGWYDYIVEVDHSSGSNGVIRFWLAPDGQTPVLRATVPQPAGSLPAITSISVGLNFNQVRAASQSQALWWGQWEVVDGSQFPNPFNVH